MPSHLGHTGHRLPEHAQVRVWWSQGSESITFQDGAQGDCPLLTPYEVAARWRALWCHAPQVPEEDRTCFALFYQSE
jgi:hypothetical protein